jgi:hypothetical protein
MKELGNILSLRAMLQELLHPKAWGSAWAAESDEQAMHQCYISAQEACEIKGGRQASSPPPAHHCMLMSARVEVVNQGLPPHHLKLLPALLPQPPQLRIIRHRLSFLESCARPSLHISA